MLAVPLPEGCCIHLDNGILHQCLSADKLIVWRIVDNVQYAGLASNCLRSPWIIPSIQAKCPKFEIATSHTNSSHSLVAGQLRHSCLPSKFIPMTKNQARTKKMSVNETQTCDINLLPHPIIIKHNRARKTSQSISHWQSNKFSWCI